MKKNGIGQTITPILSQYCIACSTSRTDRGPTQDGTGQNAAIII